MRDSRSEAALFCRKLPPPPLVARLLGSPQHQGHPRFGVYPVWHQHCARPPGFGSSSGLASHPCQRLADVACGRCDPYSTTTNDAHRDRSQQNHAHRGRERRRELDILPARRARSPPPSVPARASSSLVSAIVSTARRARPSASIPTPDHDGVGKRRAPFWVVQVVCGRFSLSSPPPWDRLPSSSPRFSAKIWGNRGPLGGGRKA